MAGGGQGFGGGQGGYGGGGQGAGGFGGGQGGFGGFGNMSLTQGGSGGGQGSGMMQAQVVPPGAIGGDLGNPIYAGTPEGDAFMARGAFGRFGGMGGFGDGMGEASIQGGNDQFGNVMGSQPWHYGGGYGGGGMGGYGMGSPYGGFGGGMGGYGMGMPYGGMGGFGSRPRGFSRGIRGYAPPMSGMGLFGRAAQPTPQPIQQVTPAAPVEKTPVDVAASTPQIPAIPEAGSEVPGYAKPGTTNPTLPLPPNPSTAQQAYDQALAQYNSPEYAAYYNSLAPSTRAFMHAPGNQAMGQYLAGQAQDSWRAWSGKDPFRRRTGGIASLAAGGSAKEGVDNDGGTPVDQKPSDSGSGSTAPKPTDLGVRNYRPYTPPSRNVYMPSVYARNAPFGTIGRNIPPQIASMSYRMPAGLRAGAPSFGRPFVYDPKGIRSLLK